MIRNPVLVTLLLATAAPAQPPAAKTLDQLHDGYQQDRMKLVRARASFEDLAELTREFVETLQIFLDKEARGIDRFNARLMLTDYLLSLNQRERAIETLSALDAAQAPALALAVAAEFAGRIGLKEKRGEWIEAAIAKQETFENRMALGMQLMTRLVEIEKGQEIFDQAFAAAKDDEQRAKVKWYETAALREREDLPDGTYEKNLDELAKSYPNTFYGSVAKDRTRAQGLEVGSEAVPLNVVGLDGKPLRLADYKGRVVLLDFWASWCGPCDKSAPEMVALYAKHKARGFEILGIPMDENKTDIQRFISRHKIPWRHAWDGRGMQNEAALRYAVDMPARMLLIGRDGKVAAMHLYPLDEQRLKETEAAIEAALNASAPR